jgi:hypothetical protein
MNQQQYQQGRNTLIDTLNWTSESISEFAGKTLENEGSSAMRDEVVEVVKELKANFNEVLDDMILSIENVNLKGNSDE